MKLLTIFFTLALVCVAVHGQGSGFQKQAEDEFQRMSFEISLDKSSYVRSEPIMVNFSFINKTTDPLYAYEPVFTQESELWVTFNGNVTKFTSLSSISGKPRRFPLSIKPNVSIRDEEIFGPSFTGSFFTVTGDYKVQFVLHSLDGSKSVKSNTLNIKIEEPTGTDKNAFEFLKRHERFFNLSSWVFQEDEETALLEEFVSKYSGSVYGDFGISGLAYSYLSRLELDKAKMEFEKLKNRENKLFADDAKRALVDIEKRKAEIQKKAKVL